jgi:hypothetical protein
MNKLQVPKPSTPANLATNSCTPKPDSMVMPFAMYNKNDLGSKLVDLACCQGART